MTETRDPLLEKVIRINEHDPVAGVQAENDHLTRRFGDVDVDWIVKEQRLVRSCGRAFDVMVIEVCGTSHEIIFDITSFFGR